VSAARSRLVSAAVFVTIVAAVLATTDVRGLGAVLLSISPAWAAAAAALNLGALLVLALRWRIIVLPLARVRFGAVLVAVLVGIVGNIVMPLKLGEGGRAWVLARRSGLPFSTALSTVLLDRAVDAAGLLLVVLPLAALTPRAGSARPAWWPIALLAAVLALGGLSATRLASRRDGGPGVFRALREHPRVRRVLAAGSVLRDRRRTLGVALLVLMAWIVRGAIVGCMVQAYGLDLPLVVVPAVLLVLNLGIGAVAMPGNAGVYEVSVAAALAVWGVPAETGLAVGVAQHAVELIPALAAGVAAIAINGPEIAGALRRSNGSGDGAEGSPG
jgi:uncharacterized membrane protein YbhN (UPF0104 family)